MPGLRLTLTAWWQRYFVSLGQLKCIAPRQDQDVLLAAYQMAELGTSLESVPILQCPRIKKAIASIEVKIGDRYIDGPDSLSEYYLPRIDDVDSFLFAVNYYLHLSRFQDVESSVYLIQHGGFGHEGINDLKPAMRELSQILKEKLEKYADVNVRLFRQDKRFEVMSAKEVFDKAATLVGPAPIKPMLLKQLSKELKEKVKEYKTKPTGDIGKSLYREVEKWTKKLEAIAALKRLVEIADSEDGIPDESKRVVQNYLAHPNSKKEPVQRTYPEELPIWDQLVSKIDRRDVLTVAGVRFARGATRVLDAVVGTDFTRQAAPKTNKETQSGRTRRQVKPAIEALSESLNVDKNFFNQASSQGVRDVATQCMLIGKMISLNYCLNKFVRQNLHGIVGFSYWGVWGAISRLLRHTFLKSLIHDTLLLVFEAEDLASQVKELVHKVQSEEDIGESEGRFYQLYEQSKNHCNSIVRNSHYAFFQNERTIAWQSLTDIFDSTEPEAPEATARFFNI